MKKSFAALIMLVVALALAISVIPAAAQQTAQYPGTITLTEAQVNSMFWVTNPLNRRISNVYVDLQPDQVTITATYTTRVARTGATETHALAVTLVPAVVNGRVQWNVTAASADGRPASGDLLNQINTHLAASWRRYVSSTRPAGHLTGVAITDTMITFSYQ